jgi:hypothetical protein
MKTRSIRIGIGGLAMLTLASGVRAADPTTRDSAVKSQAILLDGPDWRLAADDCQWRCALDADGPDG